jgi:chorismate mutase
MTTTHTPADVLLPLVVRRLAVAESVAVAKWSSGRPVEDRDREAVVLSAAAARAQRAGIDATLVYRVMAAQIEASKIVQRGLIARWRDQPASAPTSRTGLRGVRQTLEAIDEEFVTALAAPGPPVAQRRVLEQCDGLRRRALECALAPLDRSDLRGSSANGSTTSPGDTRNSPARSAPSGR